MIGGVTPNFGARSEEALGKMRKQYHIRTSDRGNLIWDVDRLHELSAGLPRQQIPLSDIRELDEEYWFGGEEDRATVRAVASHARLIAETDLSYPIILCAAGRIMDGMHRVAKAYLKGQASIAAVQFTETPEPNYVGMDLGDLPYEDAA
jgi:hypothetical protein